MAAAPVPVTFPVLVALCSLGHRRWRGKKCPVCGGSGALWKPEESSEVDKELLDYRYCSACVQEIQDDYDAAQALRQPWTQADHDAASRVFARRDGKLDL